MAGKRKQKPIESRIGWSNEKQIFIYGHNLTEDLMGHQDLGAIAFLELTGRLPNKGESVLINAMPSENSDAPRRHFRYCSNNSFS